MTTIQLEVPQNIVKSVKYWKRDQWLEKLREYRTNQQDIDMVQEEMKKKQNPLSLDEYLAKCEE